MAVCPSCRRPSPAVGRTCPHCGSELGGRTRIGSGPPADEELGSTLVGHAPLESPPPSPEACGDVGSEAPRGRRFDAGGTSTLFGHTDSRSPTDFEPHRGEPERPREPKIHQRADGVPGGTHHSANPLVGEGTWIRVRGPAPSRPLPVKARAQKRPWPKGRLLGVTVRWWTVAAAILLAGLGGAFLATWIPPRPALKVIGFEVRADGLDLLTVSCGGCQDGSTLRLGPARATLVGGVAQLTSAGLQVGENQLPLDLESPDGTVVRIEVTVALAFRVSTDLRGITGVPPYALVVVSAPRGTSVTVGGTPVASEPGVVRARIDLSAEATGPAARPMDIQRKVPVRVLGPDLERTTQATIAASVVPLVLEPPAPTRENGHLLIGGRTGPGAQVLLLQGGRTIASASADTGGRFLLRAGGATTGPALLAATTPGRISRQLLLTLR
jgi:hypothetical protein